MYSDYKTKLNNFINKLKNLIINNNNIECIKKNETIYIGQVENKLKNGIGIYLFLNELK